jgi:hypothetical protein
MTTDELKAKFDQWWEENWEGLDGLDDQDKAWIAVKNLVPHDDK